MKLVPQIYMLLLALTTLGACKKLVEVQVPDTGAKVANPYTTDATAAAVLSGIYANLSYSNLTEFGKGGLTSISAFAGLSADELTLFASNNKTYVPFYTNQLTSLSDKFQAPDYWKILYPIIYTSNSAIEGLSDAPQLTAAVKQQLLGEARFMRAFCFFYLVNLYGDVPLTLSTDWKVNTALNRAPSALVYQQIVADLKEAKSLLSETYLQGDLIGKTTERVRPTKWAATALLARTYLYTGDWTDAQTQATAMIESPLFGLVDPTSFFSTFSLRNSEAIWQLRPQNKAPYFNTGDAAFFLLPFGGPNALTNPVYLSEDFMASFEADDQRKTNWTGLNSDSAKPYYYPRKYKNGAIDQPPATFSLEYPTVLRLAEQYLIRAEARAHLGDITGAQDDLNVIRSRAGLGNTPANDPASLLAAVMQERRVELFTEWGHRWLDLKRTGKADAVMSAAATAKGASWQSSDQLYPIPSSEIALAPQLKQNPGYTP